MPQRRRRAERYAAWPEEPLKPAMPPGEIAQATEDTDSSEVLYPNTPKPRIIRRDPPAPKAPVREIQAMADAEEHIAPGPVMRHEDHQTLNAYGSPENATPHEDAPAAPTPELMATNTGVRLACTMAAMIGLFGVFLCWAEKQSRVIRRFAVQSAALTAAHAVCGIALILLGAALGSIPYLGFMVTMICWLVYISLLIVLAVLRIHLMKHAWQGLRYRLPAVLEAMLERYY